MLTSSSSLTLLCLCNEENLSIVPPELKATTLPCDMPEFADNQPKRRASAHYTLFKGVKVLSQSVGGVEITQCFHAFNAKCDRCSIMYTLKF